MLAGLPYTGLRDAILTHPTMAEGLGSLFSNVPPRSVPRRKLASVFDALANGMFSVKGSDPFSPG
jgi:hypothetical protein